VPGAKPIRAAGNFACNGSCTPYSPQRPKNSGETTGGTPVGHMAKMAMLRARQFPAPAAGVDRGLLQQGLDVPNRDAWRIVDRVEIPGSAGRDQSPIRAGQMCETVGWGMLSLRQNCPNVLVAPSGVPAGSQSVVPRMRKSGHVHNVPIVIGHVFIPCRTKVTRSKNQTGLTRKAFRRGWTETNAAPSEDVRTDGANSPFRWSRCLRREGFGPGARSTGA